MGARTYLSCLRELLPFRRHCIWRRTGAAAHAPVPVCNTCQFQAHYRRPAAYWIRDGAGCARPGFLGLFFYRWRYYEPVRTYMAGNRLYNGYTGGIFTEHIATILPLSYL